MTIELLSTPEQIREWESLYKWNKSFVLDTATAESKNIRSKHLSAAELANAVDKFPKTVVIGAGECGGRIANQFAAYGISTYVFNTSESDMSELHHIPKNRRIFTGVYDKNDYAVQSFQGTAKNRNLGKALFEENLDLYLEVLNNPEIYEAQYVWICAGLGGGTGSGALLEIANLIMEIRAEYSYINGTPYSNSVGLITSLPDEAGIEYRQNSLETIDEINNSIAEYTRTKGTNNPIDSFFANVIFIDNKHFKASDAYAKYAINHDGLISSNELSNAYVASLLMEFNSLTSIKTDTTLDYNEYQEIVSTPGYLYLHRDLLNNEFYKELKELSGFVDEDNIKKLDDLVTKYAKNFVTSEGILNVQESFAAENNSLGLALIVGVLYPKDINKNDVALYAEKIKGLLPTEKSHVTVAKVEHPGQTGITTFVSYVSLKYPNRIEELFTEHQSLKELLEQQERAKKAALEEQTQKFSALSRRSNTSNNPLASRRPNTTTSRRTTTDNVRRRERKPFGSTPQDKRPVSVDDIID